MVYLLFLLLLVHLLCREAVSYQLLPPRLVVHASLHRARFASSNNDIEDNAPLQIYPRSMKRKVDGVNRAVLPVASIAAASALAVVLGQPAMASASAGLANVNAAADQGFLQSFLLIFVSELGDKTFFIAALLAAKYGKLVSFTGSMGALAAMTIISVVIGQLFHAVPSSLTQGIPFDDYLAVAAFAYFGIKTLREASQMNTAEKSEIEEELEEAEEIVNEAASKQKKTNGVISLILQTFSLVFAAEIGDKSFLSTIALSAALNPVAVALGAIAAHGSATAVAVVGGSLMSKYLSEKVIGYIGGSLFLVFAITTAIGLF